MARKCKECPEKEMENINLENIQVKEEKTYSFPKLWITVVAKNLEEAQEKIKAMVNKDYQTKSI